MGPELPFSEQMHKEKYRGEGEGFREAMNRMASTLSDDEQHFRDFREIISDMRFLPGGRIQAAVGSTRNVTPFNCYVSATIQDSFVDGHGSIMECATEAAATMRLGGGIGYDFSTLRPRGATIKKLQSSSSGAVSFMQIFDAVCRCVASSGHRRGAQMGILRIDHPDIEEFIRAKQNSDNLTGFNISVAVTDDFMACLINNEPFKLKWGGHIYRTVKASDLWELLMRSTWDWAEPGVIFIDRINEMNNLKYCETIAATNPCGEQPLPPYGACLLGSFNLAKYVYKAEGEQGWKFDWTKFYKDIPIVINAMDNVIDVATYPLPQQKQEALSKRRMGIGITGLANAGEAIADFYGTDKFLAFELEVLQTLRNFSYKASVNRAKRKGAFPMYNENFLKSDYVKTLPYKLILEIKEHGIRNSHLISIAPTGTISLCADNVSSGIEPVFSYEFERGVFTEGGFVNETVVDYGKRVFRVEGKRSKDVSVSEHLGVLATASKFVDSAVSKTLNVPIDTSWDAFKDIYVQAWMMGCKGCTTFTTGGKREGIFVEPDEEGSACYIDNETGRHECD